MKRGRERERESKKEGNSDRGTEQHKEFAFHSYVYSQSIELTSPCHTGIPTMSIEFDDNLIY